MEKESNVTSTRYKGTIMTKDSPFIYKEAYNELRTNIDFCFQGEKHKAILVTSSIPAEGKTTLSINLAMTLAKTGVKVLLLECDLRKPTVCQKLFHKPATGKGVTSVIIGEHTLNEAVIHQENLPIDFLFAGKVPPNPLEILGSEKMKKLIETLKKQYDYIICDAPPSNVVADATVLSKYCDGVLIAVKQDVTHKEEVRKTINKFKSIDANIIGTVLTMYDFKKDTKRKRSESKYYGYYGYYGE